MPFGVICPYRPNDAVNRSHLTWPQIGSVSESVNVRDFCDYQLSCYAKFVCKIVQESEKGDLEKIKRIPDLLTSIMKVRCVKMTASLAKTSMWRVLRHENLW